MVEIENVMDDGGAGDRNGDPDIGAKVEIYGNDERVALRILRARINALPRIPDYNEKYYYII